MAGPDARRQPLAPMTPGSAASGPQRVRPIEARKIQLQGPPACGAGYQPGWQPAAGCLTRLLKLAKRAVQRRLPTGAQDAIP